MTMNEIQKQIKKINEDKEISNQAKQLRLKILKTLTQFISRDNYTEILKEQFMNKLQQLKDLDESFELKDNLLDAKKMLGKYISQSDVLKFSEENKIDNYDIIDLKFQIWNFEKRFDCDRKNLSMALDLWSASEQIMSNEEQKMNVISAGFRDIIGADIVSKYKENINQKNGDIEEVSKSSNEYIKDHQITVSKLKELYKSENILDHDTYNISIDLIDKLFEYYHNGIINIKISYNGKYL